MNNQKNEMNEYTLTDEEIKAVCGGVSSNTPGINCPHCGKFIPTTITDILTQGRLRCPYCLRVLNVNKDSLDTALRHIKHES